MFIFRVQYFWIHYDYDDDGYAVVVVLVLRYYTLSPTTSIGFFQKKKLHHPCWEYRFFWISPPEFPVKFTVIPLEFSFFFLHWPPPWKSTFFPQFLVHSLEFQQILLYVPGIFHWYPQQGVTIFFLEKPIFTYYHQPSYLYLLSVNK